jgi:uncharacterized protein YbjT (DUF2867 family)
MKVALTGATGFIGRYIVNELTKHGDRLRCWYRPTSDRSGFEPLEGSIEWVEGDLSQPDACQDLVAGCDAVVHAALHHPGGGFRGGEGDLIEFVEKNVVGTSPSQILGGPTTPKHQIVTSKLRALGMEFGGPEVLEETIAAMVEAARG